MKHLVLLSPISFTTPSPNLIAPGHFSIPRRFRRVSKSISVANERWRLCHRNRIDIIADSAIDRYRWIIERWISMYKWSRPRIRILRIDPNRGIPVLCLECYRRKSGDVTVIVFIERWVLPEP